MGDGRTVGSAVGELVGVRVGVGDGATDGDGDPGATALTLGIDEGPAELGAGVGDPGPPEQAATRAKSPTKLTNLRAMGVPLPSSASEASRRIR